VPFDLTSEDVLVEAGMIEDVFEDKVIMRANIFNGILDLDNILFNENKFPVGYLDDVIGKVESPYYVIRFFPNYTQESREKMNLLSGKSIFFVKSRSKQIVPGYLMRHKGCDASNAFDEEIHDDEMEFSDDEEEVKFKSRKKSRKNQEGMKVDSEEGANATGPRFNFTEKINLKKQKVSLEEYYGYSGNLGGKVQNNQNIQISQISQNSQNSQNFANKVNFSNSNGKMAMNNNLGNSSSASYSSEYKLNNPGINNNNSFGNNFQNNNTGFPFNMGMNNNMNQMNPNNNMNNYNMLNLMMMSMNNQMNPMTQMTNPMPNQPNNLNMNYNPMMQNFNNPGTNNNQYPFTNPSSTFPSINPFQPPVYKK
jgi:rRNA processing protein Gar1